jgi:hypothetical protein
LGPRWYCQKCDANELDETDYELLFKKPKPADLLALACKEAAAA